MNKHDFFEIGTLFLQKSYLFSPENIVNSGEFGAKSDRAMPITR
ncbi:hypothetical protein [Candidatus Tisiphia endosymbiont of Sialis lutaria]